MATAPLTDNIPWDNTSVMAWSNLWRKKLLAIATLSGKIILISSMWHIQHFPAVDRLIKLTSWRYVASGHLGFNFAEKDLDRFFKGMKTYGYPLPGIEPSELGPRPCMDVEEERAHSLHLNIIIHVISSRGKSNPLLELENP
jgi:hypothetical protein